MSRFRPEWRADPRAAFDVDETATGRGTVEVHLGGLPRRVYRNVNLSIYSAQICNARCPFCVEELRPASRGRTLEAQRQVESDDARYFARLEAALEATAPLNPSLSITGGEPSLDPRMPRILSTIRRRGLRKRTMTTNGTGLLQPVPEGGDLLDHVLAAGLAHLNLSRAHWDARENQQVMRIDPPQTEADLRTIVGRARAAGTRPRLSCVLLEGRVHDLEGCLRYLDWAASLGVDNVVFRQLMQYDPVTFVPNLITRFSDGSRVAFDPILERIHPSTTAPGHPAFEFLRQVIGYYYYVEVYCYSGPNGAVDVCLEGADLATLEWRKTHEPREVVHELVFHPDGGLCSTWQPWDGRLQ